MDGGFFDDVPETFLDDLVVFENMQLRYIRACFPSFPLLFFRRCVVLGEGCKRG